jgi:hypothetical protein
MVTIMVVPALDLPVQVQSRDAVLDDELFTEPR